MNGSWLIYLMCPLMMLPMLYMILKGNHGNTTDSDRQKHLVEELSQLKKQNDLMQQELREIKGNGKAH